MLKMSSFEPINTKGAFMTNLSLMIHFKDLEDHFDHDLELISDLLVVFIESYDSELVSLKDALDSKNFKAIELHAHTFKGMISNFFVPQLRDAAQELENMGRSEVIDGWQDPYNIISGQIDAVIESLKAKYLQVDQSKIA